MIRSDHIIQYGKIILVCLLAFFGTALGTATGFGTSTVMIPVMFLFGRVGIRRVKQKFF